LPVSSISLRPLLGSVYAVPRHSEYGRRDLFEGIVVILPAPGMANREDSTDRAFRLVHVHNVRRHDVGDAVKNRLTNLRREHRKS
jgi:hypothetical protein